jgi:membrane-associated phospholipid phosphatase
MHVLPQYSNKEWSMKNTWRSILISTAVLAVILGVFSVGTLDYSLSSALIDRHSVFGEFFNMFGEWPATLGAAAGVFLLYSGRRREKPGRNIAVNAFALPFLFLFLFFAFWSPLRYMYEFSPTGIPSWTSFTALGLTAVVFSGLIWFGNHKADLSKMRALRKVGILMLVLVFAEMILVNLIKPLWARPRMRSIESIDQFRRWFEIQGWVNNQELKSFPSGHTANGFTMIMWSLLIPGNKKAARRRFTAFAIVWGVMVAISRVILGAHFITDVAVGGYITLVLFFLLKDPLGADS